jgi:hypothetical protein
LFNYAASDWRLSSPKECAPPEHFGRAFARFMVACGNANEQTNRAVFENVSVRTDVYDILEINVAVAGRLHVF